MTLHRHILPALAVLGLLAASATALRASAAHAAYRSAVDRTEQLIADAGRLQRLRSTRAKAQLAEPPEDDVLRSVSDVIRAAGLPPRSFSGLATNGDEAVRGRTGYRRKTYRLDLSGLDATGLGGFLDRWLSAEPLWAVESIELRRQATGRRGRQSPAAYNVTLTISTVYAAANGTEAP